MYVIRERFFDIGDDFDITDETGRRLFHVDGKVLSLRNRLVLEDGSGRGVASVHRHLIALRPTYEVRISRSSGPGTSMVNFSRNGVNSALRTSAAFSPPMRTS